MKRQSATAFGPMPCHGRTTLLGSAAVLGLFLTGSGCSPDEAGFRSSDGRVVTTDSAGVTVVETVRSLWEAEPDSGWSVGEVPLLVIGGADDPRLVPLHPVESALRLEDGRVVVSSSVSRTLAWFHGATGEVLLTRGGRGDGPTEFRAAFSAPILVPPDSIVLIAMPDGGRVVWFDGEGRRRDGWIHGTEQERSPPDFRFLLPERLPTGPFVGWKIGTTSRRIEAPEAPGFSRTERALVVLSEGEQAVDTAFVGLGPASAFTDSGETFLILDATPVFTVTGSEIVVGDARDHSLRVLGADLSLRAIVRWPGTDLALDEAERAAWRQDFVEGVMEGQDPGRRAFFEELASRFRFAEDRPAFVAMTSDVLGNLWVQELDSPGEAQSFVVIDPSGRMLGRLSMPSGFRMTQAGTDFVLGVMTDHLGVETVQLHPLNKP